MIDKRKLKEKAEQMRKNMEKRGIKPLSEIIINKTLRDLYESRKDISSSLYKINR